MNVFIDCGGNIGQGMLSIMKMEEMGQDWIVYTFEPNTQLFPRLMQNCSDLIDVEKSPILVPINAAVSTQTGIVDFYIAQNDDGGSSLLHTCSIQANKGLEPVKVQVKALRLVDFIRQRTCEEDSIILKLDIEGAEYEILEDLLQDDYAVHRIMRIYVEFHDRFLPNMVEVRENLLHRLYEADIDVQEWQ